MGMKSLAEYNKKSIGEMFNLYATEPWYFEKWYEKVIMILLGSLGLWKLVGFFL